jgi:hypothetical protein
MLQRTIVERSPRPRGIGLRIAFCVACAAFGLAQLLRAEQWKGEAIEAAGTVRALRDQNEVLLRDDLACGGALLQATADAILARGEADRWQRRATFAGAKFIACEWQRTGSTVMPANPAIFGETE